MISKQFSNNSLFPLVGTKLNIVPRDYDPKNPRGMQHTPVHQLVSNKELPSLFHGSNEVFKPGSHIKAGGDMSKSEAYATSDLPTAASYAANRTAVVPDHTGNYTLFGTISKVNAPNRQNIFKDASEHGKNTAAYTSKHGYFSSGPTHLVDYSGVVTPLGKNNPVTAKNDPADARKSDFTQEQLNFGGWTEQPLVRG